MVGRLMMVLALVVSLGVSQVPAALLQNPSGQDVVTVSGSLVQVMPEETAPHDDGTEIISMIEVDGELRALPDEVTVEGSTGDQVTLEIAGTAGASGADAVAATTDGDAEIVSVEVESVPVAQASATRTLTVLPVTWPGGPGASTTVSALGDVAQRSVAFWQSQSGGAAAMPWSVSVRSWTTVAAPGSCSSAAMATLMTAALAANGMSSPSSPRDHVMVYFPYSSLCGWAGLAAVGGSYSWINGYNNTEIVAHELGHNLGLGHANTLRCPGVALVMNLSACADIEYGDVVDVMGSGVLTGVPGNLNTALADSIGLGRVSRIAPGTTTTATLAPLSQVSGTRAIVMSTAVGDVYISYRPHVSPDVRRAAWAGVQVHLRVVNPVFGYSTSYLLDTHPSRGSFVNPALAVGETWSVPGAGMAVTVLSADPVHGATVAVAPENRLPFGVWDSLSVSNGQVTVSGWAIDPDTSDPIWVHAYVGG
ncbi:MAG: hypothetical protein FWD18_11330, partial [Micrococcales bacterium]|nr:hypothetical protein [Micrococcales bacterium]